MINDFVKQTTSVESHRVAQLVGKLEGAEFDRVVSELHKLFFTEEHNLMNSSLALRQLEITIISASDLPKTDVIGSVDAFCQIVCAGTMRETAVRKREYNPNWNQTFVFKVPNDKNELVILVLDWGILSNCIIGSVQISGEMLESVLTASTEHCTEMEMQLKYNGKQVFNSQGSPSMIKFQLKNAGFAISGCDLSNLKEFFLSYDTNGDGVISEDEFSTMMKQILGVTTLFTGTESGDSVINSLSQEQVQALLRHKWVIPGNDVKSPMQSIISNIQSQNVSLPADKIQVPEGTPTKGREKILATESAAAGAVQSHSSQAKAVVWFERHGDVAAAVQPEGAGSGVPVLLDAAQGGTVKQASNENVGNGLKSMEKSLEELETLALKLRQHKVIALPTLLWGTESNGNPDSLESIAIR
jgi:hypothetical protein